uniref:Uncharacterized protein n=1 Tax=Zea mays TaxID=4577 RepID=B6U5T4_MAIZE|nr:hypothetical protein [Zea mays]
MASSSARNSAASRITVLVSKVASTTPGAAAPAPPTPPVPFTAGPGASEESRRSMCHQLSRTNARSFLPCSVRGSNC